jgi:hypothetical protein
VRSEYLERGAGTCDLDHYYPRVLAGRISFVAVVFLVAGAVVAGCGGDFDRTAATSRVPLKAASAGRITAGRTLVCKLPRGASKLPATRRHGLVQHLLQYPDIGLATRNERVRARHVLAQLVSTARKGGWSDLRAVERAGFRTRTARRKPGDRTIHYFHAERAATRSRRVVLDPRRPKALIFANAPGRPLSLVGAMWSTRDGEVGPTPAGAIMRWHSHVICLAKGKRRGTKPPASGRCPAGSRLVQGRREMLHVWFTGDLRSAFAIRAPEPELCRVGRLPSGYCEHVR